jgi:hypothetical protein
VPVSAGGIVPSGGVVESAGGMVSGGIELGGGSAGIVDGAVSAGGVMVALSSFLAQPAASNKVETASKANARMASSSRKTSDGIGSPTKRSTFPMVPTQSRS